LGCDQRDKDSDMVMKRRTDTRRREGAVLSAALAVAMVFGFAGRVSAQVYPSRPITIVVPFAAGGPTDTIARILAERMRQSLGQPVIVEDVGGAGGTIAAGRVARAPADGHLLLMSTWSTHVANSAIYHVQYDVRTDFEPVSLIVETPLMLVGKKALPANDLNELIAWLKTNPGKATLGAAGGTDQVAQFLFQQAAGIQLQTVSYRGLAPALQDLLAGQIDLQFNQPGNLLPQMRAGLIKAYAVTGKKRLAVAPDVPTVDEAGVPGLYIAPWHALWAPRGTAKAVIAKLNAATAEVLADPAVRKRLADIGQQILPSEQRTPEALAAFHEAEIEKWWPIIKASGIKAE
jgi:tripartite-type tricarboxylate transporter receptor subunit TctC